MTEVSTNIPLGGESCPKCGNTEAWHGTITEPGEDERYACDECGHWVAITITRTKQPKPPKAKRSLKFTIEVQDGALFVDIGDRSILAFRPGAYLAIGDNWELLRSTEAERRDEMATDIGRILGREYAEKDAGAQR